MASGDAGGATILHLEKSLLTTPSIIDTNDRDGNQLTKAYAAQHGCRMMTSVRRYLAQSAAFSEAFYPAPIWALSSIPSGKRFFSA